MKNTEHKKRNRSLKDYSGLVYNNLTAISLHKQYENKPPEWLYACRCGNLSIISAKSVVSGHTKSCGCIKSKTIADRNFKHGLSYIEKDTYKVWKDLRTRCNNINNKDYINYGGRGIKVCDEWDNFQTFFNDMGKKPFGLTIDRINVNGNYELNNCRWATQKEQGNNKRNTSYIYKDGIKKSLSEWHDLTGINRNTLSYRNSVGIDPFYIGDYRK